jgi:hypothetical protein
LACPWYDELASGGGAALARESAELERKLQDTVPGTVLSEVMGSENNITRMSEGYVFTDTGRCTQGTELVTDQRVCEEVADAVAVQLILASSAIEPIGCYQTAQGIVFNQANQTIGNYSGSLRGVCRAASSLNAVIGALRQGKSGASLIQTSLTPVEFILIAAAIASVAMIFVGAALILQGTFCNANAEGNGSEVGFPHNHCQQYLHNRSPCWYSHMVPGITFMVSGIVLLILTGVAAWILVGGGSLAHLGEALGNVKDTISSNPVLSELGKSLGKKALKKLKELLLDKPSLDHEEKYRICMDTLGANETGLRSKVPMFPGSAPSRMALTA